MTIPLGLIEVHDEEGNRILVEASSVQFIVEPPGAACLVELKDDTTLTVEQSGDVLRSRYDALVHALWSRLAQHEDDTPRPRPVMRDP